MIGTERLENVLVGGVLVVSLFLNAELLATIHHVSVETRGVREDLFKRTHQLKLGDRPQVLKGSDLHGVRLSFRFGHGDDGDGTILYVFAADCHYCGANTENMRALEKQTRGRYRFIGLALRDTELDSYVRDNKIDFPILRSVPKEVADAYGLYFTPETIVISSNGQVAGVWKGAYTTEMQKGIEARLDVRLPGVASLP